MISQETIEQIRLSTDIAELVREYIPEIKRAGRNFRACCPFHQEKTPSFMVSPEKGIFHCFGCGTGGDLFRFIMKMENISFTDAIKKAGIRAGVEVVDSREAKPNQSQSQKQKIYDVLELAAEYYHQCLLTLSEAEHARTYIAGRGIDQKSINRFRLGYAHRSGHALRDAAFKKGVAKDLLVKAGLIAYASHRDNPHDQFRERLMFPIYDIQGRTVAFGGRVFGNSLPKYINSAESEVFVKSKVLYGFFQGLQKLRQTKYAILLEGYTDVICAHQYGFTNAVAPLGTALTRYHALILKRYVEEVVLVFDPDTAGKSAAVRAADVLYDSGLFIKVALLPDSLDPADFLIKKGSDAFQRILDTSQDWVKFCIDNALSRFGDHPLGPRDKTNIAHEILPVIARIDDAVYKQEMRRLLAVAIDVPEGSLIEEWDRIRKKKVRKYIRAYNSHGELDEKKKTRELRIQEEIIRLLLSEPLCGESLKLEPADFSDKTCSDIFSTIMHDFSKHGAVDPARVSVAVSEADSSWISKLLFKKIELNNSVRVFEELQEELNKNSLESIRARLEKEIHEMMDGNQRMDKSKIDEYNRLTRSLKGGEKNEKV